MRAISTKEIPIATVVASSHRDLLTDRELPSSQLKSRRPQLLPRRPIFWCCDAWIRRNVACILSKEITAMPVTEVRGSHDWIVESTRKIGGNSRRMKNTSPNLQPWRRKWNTIKTVELPPTNISATDKFITKYMERVRRLLFYTKRIIDRRFTAITATVIVRDTAYHVLHSAEEILLEIIFFF